MSDFENRQPPSTETQPKDLAESKKKKKEPKQYPAKKLPGILKKNYKAAKIEKKLYKRIYVTSDLEMVRSLFVDNPAKPGFVHIPRDKMIEKVDFKRLKTIANEVKKQKGSLKLVPLLAVVIAIAAVCTLVVTFKNPLAKKGLVIGMQKIFGARTDIRRVNVEILGATITITGLQQANKNSPMENLFEIEKTEISFNLTEALRGKFDARNIEVTGLALNTPRTYSGELPRVSKKKESNPAMEAVMKEINEKKDAAINSARLSLENAFAEYNPVNMVQNVRDNLKSPGVAEDVYHQVEDAVARWQAKPAEIQKQVEDFSANVNAFASKDWSAMNNVNEIRTTITQITTMIDQSVAMTNTVKGVVDDIKEDSQRVVAISRQIDETLKADNALVNEQLKKITSFNMDTGTRILGNAIESAMYAVVGSYYPYVRQAADYAMKAKAASSNSKAEQKKAAANRKKHERMRGKDIFWKRDRVPKFLIEKIQFSGFGIAVRGTEISSDMDKRGAPATVLGSYEQGETRTHKAKVVVDARSKTENPLVGAEYTGDNYPFAFKTPYLNMDSKATILAHGSVTSSGAVVIGADFNMGTFALSADEFEPAIAHRFYTAALSAIDSLELGAELIINSTVPFALRIHSDLDERFNSILRTIVNNELQILIEEARTQITALLNEHCADVMEKISEFVDIENGINAESVKMDKLKAMLENQRKELEAKLREQTSSAINNALESSGVKIPSIPGIPGLPSTPQKSDDEAGDASESDDRSGKLGGALKGLFGR